MKVIIVGGDKVKGVIDALKNDNNLQAFGVEYTSDYESQKRTIGVVQKVVIFEKAINTLYKTIPEMVGDLPTVIVMGDKQKLSEMSVEVFSKKNIQLVEKQPKYQLSFIKEIIKDEKMKDEYLYKSEEFGVGDDEYDDNDEAVEEPRVEIKPEEIEDIENETVRVIEEPKKKVESVIEKEQNANRGIKLGFLKGKEENVEVKREATVINAKKNYSASEYTKEDEIKRIISYYKNGLVMAFSGTCNSGTSTTVYNMGRVIADMGFNTLLLDMDFRRCSLGIISKEVYEVINTPSMEGTNGMLSALQDNDIVCNAQIIRDNLSVLSSHQTCNIENIAKYGKQLEELVKNARKNYDVIIIDTRLADINKCPEIILNADELVYTVMHENKSFYELMRELINVNEPEVRKRAFSASVIYFRRGHGKIMFQDTDTLKAVDDYLENEFGLTGEYKFEDFTEVGTIPFIEGVDAMLLNRKNICDEQKYRDMYIEFLYNIFNKNEDFNYEKFGSH